MDCHGIRQRLDDYLDGELAPDVATAVGNHVAVCPACRTLLAREGEIRRALRELPVPEPTAAFFDHAIAQAAARERPRRHWQWTGLALAASVTLAIALNVLLKPTTAPVEDIPGLAITLNQVQEISLVFESDRPMENTRFTIELPDGIELSGYPGQRAISWDGSLAQGTNLLVLPVEARSGQGGELIAYVTHTGKMKYFVLRMNVLAGGETPHSQPLETVTPPTVM